MTIFIAIDPRGIMFGGIKVTMSNCFLLIGRRMSPTTEDFGVIHRIVAG